MLKPRSVTPLDGYKLRLQFMDGVQGVVDLSHLAGKGVFKVWNEPGAFQKVTIGASGEIRWTDDVELCADSLYMQITGKTPADVFPSLNQAPVDA